MSISLPCTPDAVEVTWPDGTVTPLPYLWLRDNCGCNDCRVTQTGEKRFHITSIPVDLKPERAWLLGDELNLIWPDGHATTYSGKEIRALISTSAQTWRPWGAEFRLGRADFDDFLADDRTAAALIADFLQTGAVLLVNAPRIRNTVEKLQARLGPIREIAFDRIHDVRVDPAGYNVAHTAIALPPHNDLVSFNWPPSAQVLHMLVNQVRGGESIIVDGWRAATRLREDHPDLFQTLCDTPVPFRIFDKDEETFAVSPMISLDLRGEITMFRYSNQTMQPMDPTQPGVANFYRAYHELSALVMAEDARARMRLNDGEILLVAGHRVLHAREAFEPTGERHLQDAYFEHDNIRNHLTVLKRRNGWLDMP